MAASTEKKGTFSKLALYIILAGWAGFAVYVTLFLNNNSHSFLKHFLSPEHNGIRFRALVFFLPFISMVISFLVNEREKFLRKTFISESKYKDLFENANDPIFIVDKDLNYIDVNKKAVELFGFSSEEFLNMRVPDLIPQELAAESAKGKETGQVKYSELNEKFVSKMLAKDGRSLDIEISSSAIVRDGKIVGSRDIVRDITDLKRMQDELNRINKELERHSEEKTSMLIDIKKQLLVEIGERKRLEAEMQDLIRQKE
jgi:PAS domain S-box-containing protein